MKDVVVVVVKTLPSDETAHLINTARHIAAQTSIFFALKGPRGPVGQVFFSTFLPDLVWCGGCNGCIEARNENHEERTRNGGEKKKSKMK